MSGENFVYAFPEITENKIIVRKGEVITKISFKTENLNKKGFGDKINLLFVIKPSRNEKKRISTNEIKLRGDSVKTVRDFLNENNKKDFELEAYHYEIVKQLKQ